MLNKSFSFLFVIIFFAIIVNAQEEQINYNYNPNVLVYSRGLPGELLLSSPDSAVQILFNPARALNYNTNFVYASYFSDFNKGINYTINNYYYYYALPIVYNSEIITSSVPNFPDFYEEIYTNEKNPTISINSLFGTNEKKWLISFANGVNTLDREFNDKNFITFFDPFDTTRQHIMFNNIEGDGNFDNYITKFSVINIRKTNFGNIFFGITGAINNFKDKTNTNDLITEWIHYSYQSYNRETKNYIKSEIDNKLYQGGFDFGLSTEKIDYVGKLHYVYSENKFNQLNDYFFRQIDSSYSSNYVYLHNTSRISSNKFYSKRNGMFLNNYFQKNINKSFFKNFFITLDAYYLNNKLNSESSSTNKDETIQDTIRNVNENSATAKPKSLDKNDWGIRISTGLTVDKKIDNLYILSGFILNGSHNDINYYYQSQNLPNPIDYSIINEKNNIFSLILPIYLNLDLFQFLSLYGGFNFAYQFINNETNAEQEVIYVSYNYNSENRLYTTNTDENNFKSSKSVYFGVEFKHKSGLVMQISFDEDISTFQDWNFSLGYHF